jgi:hypothetical protein
MSTTSTLSTYQPDSKESRASLSSSTLCASTDSPSSFYPSRILNVNALGIRAVRLPFPSGETEIVVTHPDGSEAYVSTRDKRWSGNCVLSHPKAGSLIKTDYFFGPKDTVLRLLQTSSVLPEQVKVTGRWASRTTSFTSPKGIEFEWKYAKEKQPDGKKVHLIVLQMAGKQDEKESRRIAQLARDKETRTPGTSKCRAGNGGELQIDDGALHEFELEESIVVATCLVMLKREIDRRRMIQCAVIAGAAGGS